jgi:uncharacterized protein
MSQFNPVSSGDITSDDKLWALLAYIFTPIVPVIIMLMEDKKSRPFLRAHNAQALAWGVVSYLIVIILGVFTLGIGSCLAIVPVIFNIIWGIKAYKGEYVTIPVLTDFVKKQGWA